MYDIEFLNVQEHTLPLCPSHAPHRLQQISPGPVYKWKRGSDWFIGLLVNLHDQKDILQITVLYHVGSPVDEPPWVTAAGRLANLEVILLQKSSSPFLVDMSSPLLSNQVPPQISTWFWLISSLPEHKSQLKSLYDCLKLHLTLAIALALYRNQILLRGKDKVLI